MIADVCGFSEIIFENVDAVRYLQNPCEHHNWKDRIGISIFSLQDNDTIRTYERHLTFETSDWQMHGDI